ncbi:phage tail family protein [Sutcliffiella horikoshii]|uniref:phage tail domain-containing protein n=1 Tax=Sutcliffiella horikoshii TaxID=79883 RepID=UPI001CBFF565|nr:phage tail domain-containing protein [Sutcliffiella horikoshii]UAL46805.1 phage tail family protein [Sutcliffiella horikoshii]
MITMDDNYRFEDFGFFCEPGNNEDPSTPNYESITVAIPGRKGLWDFGDEVRERPFSYSLKIIDQFHMNMQRRVNELVAFLLDPYGKPREIKMVRDYEPDMHYMVKLNGPIVPSRAEEEFILKINFVANDPVKYANVENHEINWDSTLVTFDDSYSIDTLYVNDVTITSPQTVKTTINGTAIIPEFLIIGSGENVVIEGNGKSFSLGTFTNATFEVKGKDYEFIKDGQETFILGEFITLMPGTNEIYITGSNMNLNFSIKVRDQYT